MEMIKAFFRTAGAAIRKNLVAVLKGYPYTSAALVIVGIGVSELLHWYF